MKSCFSKSCVILAAVVFAATALFFAPSAMAKGPGGEGPGPGGHAPDPEKMISSMVSELELTADQETSVRTIMEAHFENMKALFEKYRPAEDGQEADRSAMKTEMDALRTDLETRLATVLTAEQLEKFREMQAKHRPPHPGQKPEEL